MATTIKDIADLAGVSTATVSRVIHKNGFVKEGTRKLISALMDEHGYTPKELFNKRSNGNGKPGALRYGNFTMVWHGGPQALINLTAQAIMIGLSEGATSLGATLNIHTMGEDLDAPNAKRTDGIFLNGSTFPKAFLNKVKQFPTVWLLQSGSHEFGDRVQPDHQQVGLMSYEYFRNKGCVNLCCVSSEKRRNPPRYWQTREQAFCNAAAVDGIKCRMVNVDYTNNWDNPIRKQAKMAEEIVSQILDNGNKPDGIFVANDLGAPVYVELMSKGLIPTKNIELIAGDREVCQGYFNPEPVLIDINAKAIGELAVETMLLRLQNPDLPQITHMLKPSLIVPA